MIDGYVLPPKGTRVKHMEFLLRQNDEKNLRFETLYSQYVGVSKFVYDFCLSQGLSR